MKLVLLLAALVGCTLAQVPGFGWCPDYTPMAEFDMEKYQGVWYEAERYFTVLEAGSRCVKSNYTKGTDGKFRVSNEITNRLTGIKRVLEGVIQTVGKDGSGKIAVKYNTLPVSIDTNYNVLDTDYDTYSVVWSCSSLGPINTQNAWVMTRESVASPAALQNAYGVLDKYKISRTFFVKTDQNDCAKDTLTNQVDEVEDEKKTQAAASNVVQHTSLPGSLPQSVPGSVQGSVQVPGSPPVSVPVSVSSGLSDNLRPGVPSNLPNNIPGSLPGSFPAGSLPTLPPLRDPVRVFLTEGSLPPMPQLPIVPPQNTAQRVEVVQDPVKKESVQHESVTGSVVKQTVTNSS